ncbi:hypothetical protein KFK09_008074 [Dendrobium nobile]|uniref:Uncharacterized protein n=1 Tax=Dendrobium nobile TaxID=94219 RepID=A0A8T3BTI6_DENNO|nr:hypothetical protein KFK09_008074 [Dendrobium nobile]
MLSNSSHITFITSNTSKILLYKTSSHDKRSLGKEMAIKLPKKHTLFFFFSYKISKKNLHKNCKNSYNKAMQDLPKLHNDSCTKTAIIYPKSALFFLTKIVEKGYKSCRKLRKRTMKALPKYRRIFHVKQ